MSLAQIIKKARQSKEVSLHIAAVSSGVSATTLHYIETGKLLHPKMDVIQAITDYFNLPYDDVCIAAQRVPTDVFDKIVKHPGLIQVIRDYPV